LEDIIEAIPKTMEKFFGCSGKMVKPSTATVKALVRKIRKGKVVTLDQLREKLASDFNVQTACPASTTKVLSTLAKEDKPICYWRIVKKKGELIAKFPDGIEGQAALLESEGFEINYKTNPPILLGYETKLGKLI
jgi:alkylated DNA nucleotide flippase Atl1